MPESERWLRLLLRINAVILVLAFPAVVLPFGWMQSIHASLGMGELPATPLVSYLARTISMLYGGVGIATWWISSDPRRYGPLIQFWGTCSILGGALLLLLDLRLQMPAFWILFEGPYLIPLGCVVLWLQRRVAAFD